MTRKFECGCRFTEEDLKEVFCLPNDWPLPDTCPTHNAPYLGRRVLNETVASGL